MRHMQNTEITIRESDLWLSFAELLEYALWLGMNIPRDMDLIWIARDGLTQPLPDEWKPWYTLTPIILC